MMPRENLHATAVVLGDRGVLITGASGSGKTTLALALLGRCRDSGLNARLVADDQVYVSAKAGRLLVEAPGPTSGLAEVYGLGPRPVAHETMAVIDLLVRLFPDEQAPRLGIPSTADVAGVAIPCIDLSERGATRAILAVESRLGLPPFPPILHPDA